jgi:hypothetical protein
MHRKISFQNLAEKRQLVGPRYGGGDNNEINLKEVGWRCKD